MAFVYEINGQRVEFEKEPTDADIDEAAASLGAAPADTTSGAEQFGPQIASAAKTAVGSVNPADLASMARPGIDAAQTAYNVGKSIIGYPIDVAKNAMAWTPRSAMEIIAHPQIAVQQYIENHPLAKSNASIASLANDAGQYAKTVAPEMMAGARNLGARLGSGLVQGALAPESSFLMPYQMTAHEQEKIRANPAAPQYQSNPYAQTVRGEAATQGQAGAANQMRTVANMPYGNVSAEERAMLDEDARIKAAIRKKALEKVMGPVAPGSF
jgi:hypothetical protein